MIGYCRFKTVISKRMEDCQALLVHSMDENHEDQGPNGRSW